MSRFPDPTLGQAQSRQFEFWLHDGDSQHLITYGNAGEGKGFLGCFFFDPPTLEIM